MAKIPLGIMNVTTGKVGPVVCQRWKATNYIKAYMKPIDRKTPAQIAQRDVFKFITDIGKINYAELIKLTFLAGTIGQNYSPWNLFMRENRRQLDLLLNKERLQISYGSLKEASVDYFRFTTPGNMVTIGWDESISGNASPDDRIYIYLLFENSSNLILISDEGLRRSDTHFTLNSQSWSFWRNSICLIFAQNSEGLYSITAGKKVSYYSP